MKIAELLANPGAVIDAIVAQMSAAAMATFDGDGSLSPGEFATVQAMNRDAAIEAREFVRQIIVRELRVRGADVSDDFGALSAAEQSLLQAVPGGTA